MSDIQLGKKPRPTADRDAIHVAVIPRKAAEDLLPGQRVCLSNSGSAMVALYEEPIGIVDPFYEGRIGEGQWFWLLLLPNTVTGMRHHWSHPSFPSDSNHAPTKEESEAWLKEFAKHSDCPEYEILMAAVTEQPVDHVDGYRATAPYTIDDEYLIFWGRDAHGEIPVEFWDHVENVTGEKCRYRPSSFSCSC